MKQTNIEKVMEIYELHRRQFEKRMNSGLQGVAYGHLCACHALLTAGEIFEPDSVEVEQMQCAQDAMRSWFFGNSDDE